MDLDTLITTVYVLVDDWYTANMAERIKRKTGPQPRMSDSEVLTLAVVGQWRAGVPWQSERGVVRYMQRHGHCWFPTMLQRSAFNERVRKLWAVFIELQQYLATQLQCADDVYEVVDCVPLPACSLSQTQTHDGHWLWWSTKGYGGTKGGWYWGDQALVSVLPCGAVTGWVLASAHSDDRWLLEALLSFRAGQRMSSGPPPRQRNRVSCPPAHLGPVQACQGRPQQTYLGDPGFNGQRWASFWAQQYQCQVIAPPASHTKAKWTHALRRWFNSKCQIVETAFAMLTQYFDLQRLRAHSRWGLYTRVAIAMAAYNLGILLNRLSGRPDLSHGTLIC
jgi:hypothetical protein